MKKFIVTLLILLYSGVSFGSSLYFHFCMGELMSVSINDDSGLHCKDCGMEKTATPKCNCCHDKEHQLKIKSEQQMSAGDFQFPPLFPVYLNTENFHYSPVITYAINEEFPVSQAPPLPGSSAVYLLIRSLRI